MKYRIIGERDQNGKGHFEAQYQAKLWFGMTWWCTLEHSEMDYAWPVKFETCAEAESAITRFIRSQIRARIVVQTGEVTCP